MKRHDNRILHVDGDSFFASCEIALDSRLEGRPVWVGGGRKGDGIVIAANRIAKKFGIKTGTACFEAKRLCPRGVLCRPHYDAYRELSRRMFLILERYTPMLVPYSIDEGFLDFTTMDSVVWRNTTPRDYVENIRQHIRREVRLPVTAGLASSAKLAKLATDAAKGTGYLEVPAGDEKEFLRNRPVSDLCGVAKRRQRSLAALGALTFGHVAKLPSTLLRQKFGIWGQQLWLFANGQWTEPLVLEINDRTTISSSTTLPEDQPDYEAALTFMLSEATRLTGQLRREQMQAREFSLSIRFTDFTDVGTSYRFKHPQFLNSVVNKVMEQMFHEIMAGQWKAVRQIRMHMFNLEKLDTQPTLFGGTNEERWGALDDATHELRQQFGKFAVMTGAQLALQHNDPSQKQPKSKCPFYPQREMIERLWGRNAGQVQGILFQ
jgi:DNA polymerase-4